MPTPRFSHLHLHDHMSVLDSVGTPDEYCKRAVNLGFKSIGITNHGNIDSFIQWKSASDKHNIKVIFGCEIYIVKDISWRPEKGSKERGRNGHMCLWAKDEIGYRNLLKILSYANLYGFYYKPRCDFEYLMSHHQGLIIGTACTSSFINLDGGEEYLLKLNEEKPGDVFLEIMPHAFQMQVDHNLKCIDLSKKYDIPLLVSHDCHYVYPSNAKSQEVLLCMQSKSKMSNPDRWKFDMNDLYLCDTNYIIDSFKSQGVIEEEDYIKGIKNTQLIVNDCNLSLHKQEISFPLPPQYEGQDEEKLLRDWCINGLEKRFNGNAIPVEYIERFEKEYEVIKEKNFTRYFIIVADILSWCRQEGIMTGPRGSAAGCLISFAMGITDIDPLLYGLVFERFLSRARTQAPDIDLDIESTQRQRVIDRLKSLYGEKRVASVTTILKMEARSIIRDVARVYEVPLNEVDAFSKIIDETIDDAIENTDIGREFQQKYPEVVSVANSLQGQAKSYGRHAGGIVISPVDLDQGHCAHLVERGGQTLINWDKDDAEYVGLIKFDFLGLNAMSTLSETIKLIKEVYNKDIELYKIPLNDKAVFKDLSEGRTVGCFQIKTFLLTKMIKEIGVDNISHLSDVLALIRPGPLESGMADEYKRRKKGGAWESIHPVYEKITKDTYGICCYQEHLIFIFNQIAGLPLEVGENIRKIVGKKLGEEAFEKYKKMFVDGCLKMETLTEEQALSFWNTLLSFARYGFNKSHSISYAYNTYFTAYLKHHYPECFLTASLTCEGDTQKPALLKEAQRIGLKIIPPKIESSHALKWIAKNKCLHVPFSEVKGLGEKSVETIAQYQQSLQPGFFTSEAPALKGKLLKILQEIGAFTEEVPDTIDDYFPDLQISLKPKSKYKKLYELVGENTKWDSSKLLTGDFIGGHFGREISKINPIPKLFSCTNCNLRGGLEIPIAPVSGKYNIAIVNEAPHWDQKPEKHLFKELQKFGFEKSDFYYTNLMKCACKKPPIENIKICGEWLKQEIKEKKIFLILTMGNANVKLFAGDEQGVMRKNGTCEWNEEFGCWVVYSIGANLALWKPEEMKSKFEESIKLFVQKCEQLGGLV